MYHLIAYLGMAMGWVGLGWARTEQEHARPITEWAKGEMGPKISHRYTKLGSGMGYPWAK